MKIRQYQMILKAIESGIEGDGYTLDIRTASGANWNNVVIARGDAERDGLVEIVTDDKPPTWISIEAVESISISKEVTE